LFKNREGLGNGKGTMTGILGSEMPAKKKGAKRGSGRRARKKTNGTPKTIPKMKRRRKNPNYCRGQKLGKRKGEKHKTIGYQTRSQRYRKTPIEFPWKKKKEVKKKRVFSATIPKEEKAKDGERGGGNEMIVKTHQVDRGPP